ncbi:hypothetical protein Tdes44962_MAKER03146 [Teratosphaeria destructans]|uniref:Uncharacterized protein n=1 Tax=Teratosphaeria destructans TaxID=418781 RepID=A0A9W7SR09_9PEZI|nr:hypothetical protein Tdes44962_MAKER03146 [Teratosphaeria destructans]
MMREPKQVYSAQFFDLKLRQQISRRFQKFRPEVAADAAANVGPKERLLHSNADAMDQTQDYCNSSAAIFWSDKGTGNSTVAVSQLQETAMADCHDSTPVFAGGLINRYDAYCTIMFKQPALPQSIDSAGNTHPLASSAEQQFLLRAGQTTPPTSPYETIMPGTGANIAAGTNAAAALSFNSPSINQQFPFTASQITPPTSPYGIATTNTAAGQRFTLPPTPYISTNQSMPPNTVGTMNTFATKPASDLGVNGNDLRYTRAMSPSTMPDAIAVEPWALTTHDTSAFGSFDDFVDMAQASVTVGNFEVDLVSPEIGRLVVRFDDLRDDMTLSNVDAK